jgi:hypothetical protein
MQPLTLSPLPSQRAEDPSGSQFLEQEGFVDEGVVRSMVSGTYFSRTTAYPEDLALAADDSDYAGWQVTQSRMPRAAEVPPQVISAIVRHSTPPTAGNTVRHSQAGKRRWWLAGLALSLSSLGVLALMSARSHAPAMPPHGPITSPSGIHADHAAVQP